MTLPNLLEISIYQPRCPQGPMMAPCELGKYSYITNDSNDFETDPNLVTIAI